MTNDDPTAAIRVTPAEWVAFDERMNQFITACVLAFLDRGKITPDQADQYLQETQ